MNVSSHLILKALRRELFTFFGSDHVEASSGQSVMSAIQLLEIREAGGAAELQRRLQKLGALIKRLITGWPDLSKAAPQLNSLAAAVAEASRLDAKEALEPAWDHLLSGFEVLVTQVAAPDLHLQREFLLTISDWEIADRHSLTVVRPDSQGELPDTSFTQERFQNYLRDRYSEPALQVTAFEQLAGGFGKETYLAGVIGVALHGEIVVRRDPLIVTVANDCHWIRKEYPVIRAAFERGFPAPETLWLDTDHLLLPGGDFIVMRKALGRPGGNVFGAEKVTSDTFVKMLAGSLAHLHGLPACLELGSLTESINTDAWKLSLAESTERYIRGWFKVFMAQAHSPSPTLVSLYQWLLNNIPEAPGAPVLLHGDVGFHNMIVDDGRLSAVVDWEFSHVGDPAEDLGFVKNTSRNMPWDRFMQCYLEAGGSAISSERIHFFEVWGFVRNASASNLATGRFANGQLHDLKLAYTGNYHFPLFIQAACDLVRAAPGRGGAEFQGGDGRG